MFISKIITFFILLACAHIKILSTCFAQNKIVVYFLLIATLFSVFYLNKQKKTNFSVFNSVAIIFPFFINLINLFFLHYSLISKATFLFGYFAIINLFSNKSHQIRIFWLSLIAFLLLPLKEYFQIFIGVPIRLFCADFLELVFRILNIKINSFDSILVFENNITNIDYPCSGSLTIYYSILFILIIAFIFKKEPNLKFFIKSGLCLIISSFLNILRIFILALFYNFNFFYIDKIHTLLGIINYSAVCILFYLLIKNNKEKIPKNYSVNYSVILSIIFLCTILPIFSPNSKDRNSEFKIIKKEGYENIDFSDSELSYYKNCGGRIEKYKDDDKIILKIESDNFLSVHNPMVCAKSNGKKIYEIKTMLINNNPITILITDKGYIYCQFLVNNKMCSDYYLCIFKSLFSKEKTVKLNLVYTGRKLEAGEISDLVHYFQ